MNVRVGDPFSGHEVVSVTGLVTPVLLCGGPTLWQLAHRPKSRLSPGPKAAETLFQSTLRGLTESAYAPSIIATSSANRSLVCRQIGELDLGQVQVLCDGTVWNENSALLDATARIAAVEPDTVLLVLRPGHQMQTQFVLDQAVALGLQMAREGRIVLFGVRPDRPATDRDWVEPSDNLQIAAPVARYFTKPDPQQALNLFAAKNCLFDAGILLVSARTLLEEAAKATQPKSPSDLGSIGHTLLETSPRLSVIRISAGWDEQVRNEQAVAPQFPSKAVFDRLADLLAPAVSTGSGIETRPWGKFEVVAGGGGYQVKRIIVKPGGRLSLQSHRHRAEHWVVVQGKARVTIGKTVSNLSTNASVFIQRGEVHRLENLETQPLILIEVQSGGYLGEDDIVRYEDAYDRV